MAQVFYRKYRPKAFSEFVGQEHIVRTLTNGLSSGLISHAYLFSGPRGSGKTSLARLFAKAVNCESRKKGESEPCNKCSSCLEINGGRSIDLIEIDAASHRGIDEVRELRDGIRFVPIKSKYKVFIFDESHQLTKEAANALLKTLEEPPSHAIFILATTEIHKMIPTIISRCQRFDFRRLTLKEILEKLETICQKEKVKIVLRQAQDNPEQGRRIEKPALELIALNSQGSLRDAESLLDQVFTLYGQDPSAGSGQAQEIKAQDLKDLLGLVEIGIISQFTEFLAQKKPAEAINLLNEINEKGLDLAEFAKTLLNYLRQALILKIMGEDGPPTNNYWWGAGLTKEEFQKLKEQSEIFKEEEIKKIINLFLEAQTKMRYSPIPQLPLELAIIESCGVV